MKRNRLDTFAFKPEPGRARLAAGGAGSLPRLFDELLAALPVASRLVMLTALAQAAGPAATAPAGAPATAPADP